MIQSRLRRWSIPLFYLGLLILNFGIYIPLLGLYGDDWQYLYSYHLFGASGYPAFVAADRPFSAWVYMLFTPLLCETVWAYHVVLLVLRWAAAVLFWQVLKALFVRHGELAFWAGTILAVYPGFRQQPLPLEFILHFSVLNLTLFSLFCMLKSAERGTDRWKWTVPGVLSAFGIFSVEYFTGLELLRPVLLWVKLKSAYPKRHERLRAVLLNWLPYLVVFCMFLYWRVFVFSFQHYKPSLDGASNPIKMLVGIGWQASNSIWLALIKGWEIKLDAGEGLPSVLLQIFMLLVGFAVIHHGMRRAYPQQSPISAEPTGEEHLIAGLGIAAVALAGPLYWLLGIPVQQDFPWDRPLLSFIPGVGILLSGTAVRYLMPKKRSVILAGLCAAALIINYQNAKTYIQEWNDVRSYATQLTARIPQVDQETILLTQNLPFRYFGENTFFPMLNWIYRPHRIGSDMHVRMFDLSIRDGESVAVLESGRESSQHYRSFRFSSDKNHVIAYTYQPPACLHLLYPDDLDYPGLPDKLGDLLYLSNPSLIQTNPEVPSALPAVMGEPASKNWCVLYQIAERKRQDQDWRAVQSIAAVAKEQGFKPAVGFEYLPFIEAFARTGEWEQANMYFRLAKTGDPEGDMYVCSRWRSIAPSLEQEPANQMATEYCAE